MLVGWSLKFDMLGLCEIGDVFVFREFLVVFGIGFGGI